MASTSYYSFKYSILIHWNNCKEGNFVPQMYPRQSFSGLLPFHQYCMNAVLSLIWMRPPCWRSGSANTLAIIMMKDKIIDTVIAVQGCKILSHSIINLCTVFWCLVSLQIHGSFTQTDFLDPMCLVTGTWNDTPTKTQLIECFNTGLSVHLGPNFICLTKHFLKRIKVRLHELLQHDQLQTAL